MLYWQPHFQIVPYPCVLLFMMLGIWFTAIDEGKQEKNSMDYYYYCIALSVCCGVCSCVLYFLSFVFFREYENFFLCVPFNFRVYFYFHFYYLLDVLLLSCGYYCDTCQNNNNFSRSPITLSLKQHYEHWYTPPNCPFIYWLCCYFYFMMYDIINLLRLIHWFYSRLVRLFDSELATIEPPIQIIYSYGSCMHSMLCWCYYKIL